MLNSLFIVFTLLCLTDALNIPTTVEEFKEVLRSFNNYEEMKNLTRDPMDTLVYANVNYPVDFNPITEMIEYYENHVLSQNFTKILEIGPGVRPFKHASHTIDYLPTNEKNKTSVLHIKLDLDTDTFPFEDNYFDFVYCRHVLQELNHPVNAYNEMTRVAKNGFIETPSPLAEALRYNIYSGYGYHGHPNSRYMFFTDIVGNVLYAIPKLPSIEYISPSIFGTPDIEAVAAYIVENLKYSWNNYYSWTWNNKNTTDTINTKNMKTSNSSTATGSNINNLPGYNPIAVTKLGIDFSLSSLHATGEYATLIRLAICNAMDNGAMYGN